MMQAINNLAIVMLPVIVMGLVVLLEGFFTK
jgi:hypothetical protein